MKDPWEDEGSVGGRRIRGRTKDPWKDEGSVGGRRIRGRTKDPWEDEGSVGGRRICCSGETTVQERTSEFG
ncbi:hypothetical protein KUCAC02_035005 [Chaenocephalus aceratus]|nr:hypothetical protein KUCAC02_035005 [Chaenocephalus aceratus]